VRYLTQMSITYRTTEFARLASVALVSTALLIGLAPVSVQAQDTPSTVQNAVPSELAGETPSTPLSQLAGQSVERQVAWLNHAASSGQLEKLSDPQLLELFQSLKPDTLSRYVQAGSTHYREYQFQMFSQQRVRGVWQEQAAHMLVRYRQEPRQVYAKWLADGRSAGQEMIYDEQKNPDQIYAHQGGLFHFVAMWTPINGDRAMAQSNHTVRELSLGFVTDLYLTEMKKYRAAGVEKPIKIEVLEDHGARVVAFTWEAPTGQPEFYAKRERLGLDLRHPFFRTAESWDKQGEIFEKFSFTDVVLKHFDEATFDPKNPEYGF